MNKTISIILVLCLFLTPSLAHASKAKEILVTSTYGVVAGTIVGVASLAFSGSPGSHLRNIAVGASLGLYAGILLGTYLAYAVQLEPEAEKDGTVEEEDDEEYDEEEDEDLPAEKDDKTKGKKKAEYSNIRLASAEPVYTQTGTSNYNNIDPRLIQQIRGTTIIVPVIDIRF